MIRPAQGGMRTQGISVISNLVSMGLELEIAGPSGWQPVARDLNVKYHFAPIKDGMDPLSDLKALTCLRRSARQGRYSIIHVHGAKAALLSRMALSGTAGTSMVYSIHGFLVRPGMPVWQRILYPLGERGLSGRTDRFIAVSQAVKKDFCERTGVLPERCRVIHNGVDLNRFVPGKGLSYRRKMGLGDSLVIGTVARLVKEKGLDLFLKAASVIRTRFPGTVFMIVGDGPLREGLEAMASDLGLGDDIVFTGEVECVEQILQAMDIIVLPSVSEGLSLVALETMASGKPLVASNTGGIPEVVIEGVTGLLFPPGNLGELIKALDVLLADELSRRRMGEAGRQRARLFDLGHTSRLILEVYEEVLRGNGSGKEGRR